MRSGREHLLRLDGKAEGGVGGQFQELLESVKRASAVAESRAIQTILADDSWQSKAWYLERRFPERWGRKDRLNAHHTRRTEGCFPYNQTNE